jgi:hypothetical protein
MYKAIGVVIRTDKSKRFAYAVSRSNTLLPIIRRKRLHSESQDTHGDRANLPMSDSEDIAVSGTHLHDIALARRIRRIVRVKDNTRYRTGEYPGMETEERFLLMRF